MDSELISEVRQALSRDDLEPTDVEIIRAIEAVRHHDGWQCMWDTVPPPSTKFVALFSDGSGADVFYTDKSGRVFDCKGCPHPPLFASGYSAWRYLPDDFALWCDPDKASEGE